LTLLAAHPPRRTGSPPRQSAPPRPRPRGAATSPGRGRRRRPRARAGRAGRRAGRGAAEPVRAPPSAARRPAYAASPPPPPLRPAPAGRPTPRPRSRRRPPSRRARRRRSSSAVSGEPPHVALLPPPHRRPRAARPLGVVVAQDVQGAVHGKTDHFDAKVLSGPLLGGRGTEIDVSHHRVVGLGQRVGDDVGHPAAARGAAV